ncbi:MAG: hypothetical protein ACLFUU_11845 [Desulfobacteraceae bacterium]
MGQAGAKGGIQTRLSHCGRKMLLGLPQFVLISQEPALVVDQALFIIKVLTLRQG